MATKKTVNSSVTLTRAQIEQIVVWYNLYQQPQEVTITEYHSSGIGAGHVLEWTQNNRTLTYDITDVSTW